MDANGENNPKTLEKRKMTYMEREQNSAVAVLFSRTRKNAPIAVMMKTVTTNAKSASSLKRRFVDRNRKIHSHEYDEQIRQQTD
jgi:hypothetical protein